MTILGIIGERNEPYSHDGAAALVIDNKIVYAIEQERLSRNRYAVGEGAYDAITACLEHTGYQLSDIDHIAYGWLPHLKSGTQIADNIYVSDELTQFFAACGTLQKVLRLPPPCGEGWGGGLELFKHRCACPPP